MGHPLEDHNMINEAVKNQICSMSHLSKSELSKRFGFSRRTIRQILSSRGLAIELAPGYHRLPKKMSEVVRLYALSKSTAEISQKLGMSRWTVREILQAKGVRAISTPPSLRSGFRSNFFSTIDSEEKAYWLGFITADGCRFGCQSPRRVCDGLIDR